MSNFITVRTVAAELLRADGWADGRTDRHTETEQTNITYLIDVFRRFANVPKKAVPI
jgi:hypothetical protein